MIDAPAWYIVVSGLGWLAFPIAYRLLPALKDRGYAVSRALGLLLWGWLFWLPATLGILPNRIDGLLFAVALLAALGIWALGGIPRGELRAWLRSQRATLLTVEALFLIAFAGWAWVRAANPEAVGTEKPMELAFINAVIGSPTFPPHDPWLSGYAISYYYFGYVLVGMLAKLTGVAGGVAFNLGLSMLFALSAVGVYGLVYNLLNSRQRLHRGELVAEKHEPPAAPRYTLAALVAPLLLLIVSNLEGFLHLLHHHGLFWSRDPNGALVSPFWKWLDIQDLSLPPVNLPPASPTPDRFWWWWRASRVLQDYDLAGGPREIIDEFPFFSYLLGDVHPHVLAMPFAMLAMTLALNLFLGGASGMTGWPRLDLRRIPAWASIALTMFAALIAGLGVVNLGEALAALDVPQGLQAAAEAGGASGLLLIAAGALLAVLGGWLLAEKRNAHAAGFDVASAGPFIDASIRLNPAFVLLCALALGGMAFLNTWDFPVYVALVAAAYALGRMLDEGRSFAQAGGDFLRLGLVLGAGGGLLYFPFYLGFSSQAGGVVPNLVYVTRGAHFWVMFAPLLLPLIVFSFHLARRSTSRGEMRRGWLLSGGTALALWVAAAILTGLILLLPQAGSLLLGSVAAEDGATLFRAALTRRVLQPGAWLSLVILIAPALGLLATLPRRVGEAAATEQPDPNRAEVFALLLVVLGGLLALGPEFFFLRDLFGWRMNTIFKFYFQIWLIWSAAAAYASIRLLESLHGASRAAFGVALAALLAAGLVYPFTSLPGKTNNFQPAAWTLDAAEYFDRASPDEHNALVWLKNRPFGVIVEAVAAGGGSYTEYGRFSTLSGKPAVLGWVGHENQWRGESGRQALGSRQADIMRLYCTRSWDEAVEILERYAIRYIVVGSLERAAYTPAAEACTNGLVEVKFQRNLPAAFQSGNVTIYEYFAERND